MAFHIALNMAGAVSAGAYTAGVLDFLVEALDEWYDARETQRAQHGDDVSSWNVPAHEVIVDVLSGASAGGMCAAISSVALQEEFDHVHQTGLPAGAAANRLYRSWVQTIDILPLLGTADLAQKDSPVHSLLDSTPIEKIANAMLAPQPGRAKKREWIADRMAVILTLSNMRGIPYSVDQSNAGSFEERIAYHADRIQFTVGKGQTDADSVALNPVDPADPNWPVLRTAAMATGAFPVMLSSRILNRQRADYENRKWNAGNGEPDNIMPAWDGAAPATFPNVYVDGGVTNNNPFECARQFLVKAAGNVSHNPRDPMEANAAVITVAPFPGHEPFDPKYNAAQQSELLPVVKSLVGTLISQSRFQGEDLRLTKDENVSSRFAIAPVDDSAGDHPALMCGSLAAFGGFVDQNFRDRDYQLGRYNCQQFLRRHFVLPAGNATIAAGVRKKPEIQEAFDAQFSFVENGTRWYPIIPLMPRLQPKIDLPARDQFKTTPAKVEEVASAATDRLKAVLHALLNEPGQSHGGLSFLVSAIFDLGGSGKIRSKIRDLLTKELSKTGQV